MSPVQPAYSQDVSDFEKRAKDAKGTADSNANEQLVATMHRLHQIRTDYESREWTDSEGNTLRASFDKVFGGMVHLRTRRDQVIAKLGACPRIRKPAIPWFFSGSFCF